MGLVALSSSSASFLFFCCSWQDPGHGPITLLVWGGWWVMLWLLVLYATCRCGGQWHGWRFPASWCLRKQLALTAPWKRQSWQRTLGTGCEGLQVGLLCNCSTACACPSFRISCVNLEGKVVFLDSHTTKQVVCQSAEGLCSDEMMTAKFKQNSSILLS